MTRQLARDPFARLTLMKGRGTTKANCGWCGQKDRRGKVYPFWWEADDSRMIRGAVPNEMFCSVACFRSYHS